MASDVIERAIKEAKSLERYASRHKEYSSEAVSATAGAQLLRELTAELASLRSQLAAAEEMLRNMLHCWKNNEGISRSKGLGVHFDDVETFLNNLKGGA